MNQPAKRRRAPAASAFNFVLTLGIVNRFADVTYEGGASINGPFLGSLGAGAAAISIVAGAGEFPGYRLRFFAGYVADQTGGYWPVTSTGSVMQRLAVRAKGFTRAVWLYMLAGSFCAAGLMSFEFVSFHLASTGTVTETWIPLFLAISTGLGVLASLVLGRLYDRIGLPVILAAVFL